MRSLPDAKMPETRHVARPVEWLFAPEWLTLEQACYLSGWDEGDTLKIIQVGGVDLSVSGLIETASLRE